MLYRAKKIDYTTPSSAQGGPGIQKQFPWYGSTPYINMTAAVYSGVQQAIGASLGDIWWLGGQAPASGGNAFMFIRARAALSLGQIVTPALPAAGTVSAVVQSTSYVIQSTSFAASGVNGEVDNYVFVTSAAVGATVPQLRRIKANDNAATGKATVSLPDYLRPNSPQDADVFDSIPVAGEVTAIIRPYNVIVNTATTTPIGVALGTVTSGNYTIIQVAGLANILAKGDGTALAANVPASGGAAGVVTGVAPPAAYYGASLILPQVPTASASFMIPAYVNFIGQ